jgi:hypothetical protein
MKLKELLKFVQDAVVKAESLETKEEVLQVLKDVNDLLVNLFKDFQIVKRPKKG